MCLVISGWLMRDATLAHTRKAMGVLMLPKGIGRQNSGRLYAMPGYMDE